MSPGHISLINASVTHVAARDPDKREEGFSGLKFQFHYFEAIPRSSRRCRRVRFLGAEMSENWLLEMHWSDVAAAAAGENAV